ncbi:hypothetical protein J6590_086187 [Homalodisca vitripennis]|nr:hypothetical protein J6590_086187 [Homalodisca vitripennis]
MLTVITQRPGALRVGLYQRLDTFSGQKHSEFSKREELPEDMVLLHFSKADSFQDSAAPRGREMIDFGIYQRPGPAKTLVLSVDQTYHIS